MRIGVLLIFVISPFLVLGQDKITPSEGIDTEKPVDVQTEKQGDVSKTKQETSQGDKGDVSQSDAEKSEEEIPSLDDILAKEASEIAKEWKGSDAPKQTPQFSIEHHGYFRLRTEGFYRAHLGTQHVMPNQTTVMTSGFPPPLTSNGANTSSINKGQVGSQGELWLAGANMRFRYAPIVHLPLGLRIHAELDCLDNLLLGSTPDYHPNRPDAPLSIFAKTQAPPSAGVNGFKDAIRVKQAYMVWNIFEPRNLDGFLMSFSAGRMARHWGLGILENNGEDLDADYGTYVDRVNLLLRIYRIYAEIGYGWVSSGVTSESPKIYFGESHDMTDRDDVTEVTFSIFQKPMTDAERKARYDRMIVRNKPVLDYGFYLVWRRQELDVEEKSWLAYQQGIYDTQVPEGGYDKIKLVKRNAWTLTPDIFIKLEWVPRLYERWFFAIEGAGVFGRIGQLFEDDPNSSMDIRAFGGAFQGQYTWKGLTVGLHAGFATGDTAEYFGFLDKSNFMNQNMHNPTLASFYFNPDYRVDTLLFRHVIGTVTNAMYYKAFGEYDLFESEKQSLGGRVELLYARALERSATPGNDPNLGVELNLKVFYEEKDMFFAGIDWAVLWPLDAFDLIPSFENVGISTKSKWSTAIRARVGVMF